MSKTLNTEINELITEITRQIPLKSEITPIGDGVVVIKGDRLLRALDHMQSEIDSVKEDRGFWKKEAMLHSDAREQFKAENENIRAKIEKHIEYGQFQLEQRVKGDREILELRFQLAALQPKPITEDVEKEIEKAAREHQPGEFDGADGIRDVHFTAGARAFYSKGLEAGKVEGVEWSIEFLDKNAGNYCACQSAPDYLLCEKHAQTHSRSILQDEAIRQGILKPDGAAK